MTRIENSPRESLVMQLEGMRDSFRAKLRLDGTEKDFVYAGAADFLLQHGKWYTPVPLPPYVTPGSPHHCYANSIIGAFEYKWRYVEGFTILPHPYYPVAVAHAWNVDAAGRMYDRTLIERLGAEYIGVEFHPGRADDATWNGDASVLDDFNRNHPLFREPWKGEDWSRTWPLSQASAAYVSRDVSKLGEAMRGLEVVLSPPPIVSTVKDLLRQYPSSPLEIGVSEATEENVRELRTFFTDEENQRLNIRIQT